MEMKHYLLSFRVRRNGRGSRKIVKIFVAQDDAHARRRRDDEVKRFHRGVKNIKLFVLFTIQV